MPFFRFEEIDFYFEQMGACGLKIHPTRLHLKIRAFWYGEGLNLV